MFPLVTSSLTLLVCPSPQTAGEIQCYVYKEDYSYLSSKVGVVHQKELEKMSYQMCRMSGILIFDDGGKGDIFMPDCLRKDKKVLQENINTFTIERVWYLEELT